MTTTYIGIDIEIDAEQMIEEVYEDLAVKFPGWTPAAGNLETFLVRAMVYRLVVPAVEMAADVPAEIFQRFGEAIANVPVIQSAAATSTVTFTVKDTAGYTIPQGTDLLLAVSGDEKVGFQTIDETVIAVGDDTAVGVPIEAVEVGEAGNELDNPIEVSEALEFVTDVVLDAPTSGGTDGEDVLDYLNRLAATMQTLAPRPILPADVEILARGVPGVIRAVAIDGYDPGDFAGYDPADPDTWKERLLSVAVVDENGAALSGTIKDAVEAELAAKRETTFVFHVIDPTFTTIHVNLQVVPYPGVAQAAAEANVIAAVTSFLSPENWGKLPFGQDPNMWVNVPKVYFQDLVTVVNNAEGVDHYTNLEVKKGAGSFGTADITLDTPAPLTTPGTIQVA